MGHDDTVGTRGAGSEFLADIEASLGEKSHYEGPTIEYQEPQVPMTNELPDMDEMFASENGQTMTRRQMGYAQWKRGVEIERTDEGFVVDGIVYRPIDDAE